MESPFLQNKYTKWYFSLVQKRRIESPTEGYYERHHVIPRACGGGNSTDNIVKLTAKEHFIAHLLLTKAVGGRHAFAMKKALSGMANWKNKRKLTSIQYGKVRAAVAETSRGRKMPEDAKEAIRRSKLGENNSFYGKSHGDDTRKRISEGLKRRYELDPTFKARVSPLGQIRTKETRLRMSASNKERYANPDYWITCESCNVTIPKNIFSRYHKEHRS